MNSGALGRGLLPHPRPVRRKTSDLDGYYKNGIPITTAMIGDTVTWDVPGHSPGTVYLVQNVNGQPGYTGPIAVPMAPFLLTPGQQTGLWSNTVYDKQGGSVIETDSLTIQPQASPTVNAPTGIQCPDGYTYYPAYKDPNGNMQPPGCMLTPQKTGTTTTPTQTGGGTAGGGGTTSSTTTTTTTSSGGGGSPVAAAPPSDTLLLLAVAALAFVVLK